MQKVHLILPSGICSLVNIQIMKSYIILFIQLVLLCIAKSVLCQELEMNIKYNDTLYITPGDEYSYLSIEILNHTKDSLYLPGFRVANAEYPSFYEYFAYKREMEKVKNLGLMTMPDSILIKNQRSATGNVIMFIKNSWNDSLVEIKPYCYFRNYLEDESRANYDTAPAVNPWHMLPQPLYSYQRMLKLPPNSSTTHRFYCDFKCFNLEIGKTYKLFLLYSFNYQALLDISPFGIENNNLNFIKTSLKSNEINLERGYIIKKDIKHY
jgi:hypothetical protein